jgi:hypothetical protein
MPPPLSVYIEAAKRFAKINSDDVAVIEDFYVRVFPGLAQARKEKILAYILEHEGPTSAQPVKQAPPVGVTPPTTPPLSRRKLLTGLPTTSTIPIFFGAALAKSFEPVARMPRRLS